MEDAFEQVITLDGPVFAINERSPTGIPAVELDTTLGKHVVLVFTSHDAANKWCYLHRPNAAPNIYELTRKTIDGEITQVGLIKIARILLRGYPEIQWFVIDHPGARGRASYISVEDVAFLGRKKPDEIQEDNFQSAMDEALSE